MDNEDQVLSVQQVAGEIGCSESILYNKINDNKIPYQRINKKTCVFFRKDLERIRMAIEPRSNSKSAKLIKVEVELESVLKELKSVSNLLNSIEDIRSRLVRLESKFHTVYSHVLPNEKYADKQEQPKVGDLIKRSLFKT